MKKQTNLSRLHAGKLSLNKKTISNLTAAEMSKHVGGSTSCNYTSNSNPRVCGATHNNANTCYGHNTCYNC